MVLFACIKRFGERASRGSLFKSLVVEIFRQKNHSPWHQKGMTFCVFCLLGVLIRLVLTRSSELEGCKEMLLVIDLGGYEGICLCFYMHSSKGWHLTFN